MEFLILLVAWVLPIAAVVFTVGALWRILQSLGAIEAQLAQISASLQKDRVS
jgi:hypothetical protein